MAKKRNIEIKSIANLNK
ncbi:MAG: hypothetical protein KGJ89_04510 [Patescibacteria group bacterium]|nr:hypothetical protein [Patescibacteria group bacterium]MDE2015814.1 hypothetical protein [Patescibacteria group bacterium]MDE2227189.1 hypothetical protein [Patescibacteria group bacterium]